MTPPPNARPLAVLVGELELLDKLRAIICELDVDGDGPEVARVLAEGALEELEDALTEERRA